MHVLCIELESEYCLQLKIVFLYWNAGSTHRIGYYCFSMMFVCETVVPMAVAYEANV